MSKSVALVVLGEVLAEARTLVGRSPEQVAVVLGLSGRTVRRLERAEVARPRMLTLDALAGFYALDPIVLSGLVAWAGLSEGELRTELTALEQQAGLREEGDSGLAGIAMRVARRGVGTMVARRAGGDVELEALVEDFLALDRRRRMMARLLIQDLRVASAQPAGGRPAP